MVKVKIEYTKNEEALQKKLANLERKIQDLNTRVKELENDMDAALKRVINYQED